MAIVPMLKTAAPVLPAIDALVDALQQRTSWPMMRDALKREKFPVGLGWKELLGHAAENTPQGQKMRTFLQTYFAESTITGDRFIQLYEVEEQVISSIVGKLTNVTAPNSVFSDCYPLPLAKKLLPGAPEEPILCEVRSHASGDVSLVFCSVRSFDDRLSYQYAELPKQVQDTYREIDKLITIRKDYYQAYDVINIRKDLHRLEICIDQPGKSGSGDLDTLPLKVLTACALHISDLVGFGAIPPENLFPAISAMYASKNEGTVKSLSFRTMTGSIKKERMTSQSVDLRDEKFHHAGMNAVGQKIDPYEISLDLEFTLPPGQASLRLAALIREIASATPTLHGCYVSAATSSSLQQALNRLVTYIY